MKGWEVEAYLHGVSRKIMGWPPYNAWLYPTVKVWDENNIPAYIYFFRNPEKKITDQEQQELDRLLNRLLPGPYDLDWHADPVFVLAIRRHIRVITRESERTTRIDQYSTIEYERMASNGYRKIRDGNVLFLVPYDESDSSEVL